MASKKITKTDLMQALREAIVCGEFVAGTHLRLDELATKYDVSTMPIREVLGSLEAEGVVYSVPHRGSFVTRFSANELLDIFEMQATLEKMATRDAIPHFTIKDFDFLQNIVDNWYTEGNNIVWLIQQNDQFHQHIYKLAKRSHLYNEIMTLRSRTRHYLHSYITEMGHFKSGKQDHQDLIDAFKLGTPKLASELIFEHVWDVGLSLANYVNEKASL
ncbi:MAG: GntR family transcriptional regulator [Phototrophicaceae bacterium]